MNIRYITGKISEEKAANFLQAQEHVILKRNFRIRQGEIDIISHCEHTIYFIEVKYRKKNTMIQPLEILNQSKRDRMRMVAEVYLADFLPGSESSVSFGLIYITETGQIDFYHDLF